MMRKKLTAKIRNSFGETLAETLVAVLIVSLASALLAAMIASASRMNLSAKKYDKSLDEAILSMTSGEPSSGNITISIGTSSVVFPADIKTYDGELTLSSYSYHEAS